MILDNYQPSPEWFTHNPLGIHGIGHVTRVLVWADRIAQAMIDSGQHVDIEIVRWSAVIHDVGRINDGRDPDHGVRSATWLEKYTKLFPHLDKRQLDSIMYCCTWHVPQDQLIPDITVELRCLKDADGLDRVRIRDLDTHYLRTALARDRAADAQFLFDKTRQATEDPWAVVRSAAMQKGWWR